MKYARKRMSASDGSVAPVGCGARLVLVFFAAAEPDFFFAEDFFAAGVLADFVRFFAGDGVAVVTAVEPLVAVEVSSVAASFLEILGTGGGC